MFQILLSQLEIHDAGVSQEDANQKFLRSLPSSWSQVALIMRTKPGLGTLSFDDLFNNLRVFERDVKGTTASSSSNTQNVAFVSTDNTSSTNDVSTAYSVSSPSVSKSHKKGSSSYTNEVIHSFFANQSSALQLDYDDLEQINDDEMVEMDLKWQVAMISMRIKKFYKRTGRKLQFDTKDPVGFDKTKVECFNCHKTGHFARDCRAKGNQDSRRRDGGYNGNKARDNGNCMPSRTDVEIDYSKFTYGPKQTSPDKSDSKLVKYAFSESDCSVETTTSMPVPVDNAPKIVYEPKVWTDASIIEEYESASDDDSVSNDDPHKALKDKGIVNSGCSRHMIKNKAHFVDYQEFKGGSVAFGGSNGRITGKGKIKAGRLDFEDVYYVEELKHYNLFSVSQMCDKKNKGNLVRGLPSKIFENDHTCVACQKGKQHKAPCKFDGKSNSGFLVGYSLNNKLLSLTPTTKIHTIHPKTQILGDPMSAGQTKSKVNKNSEAHALVWILIDLPFRKKEIRTKWVYRNKKDEIGVVVRNKERLVAQGHTQEEGIDYDDVFAVVARIEAIRIFLAFAFYMGFIVYQMDVKSAFLYDTINKEVYVIQPPGFVDLKFP
nr:ribonuclease H-like domain-containing protein [Tanacetum cinerariifolium]